MDLIYLSADFILNNNASLGYRKSNTAYTVGDIAYHSALPTGWYLECTTKGTSGSGDLTISSPHVSGIITDGTITWTIRQMMSTKNLYGFNSGVLATGLAQIYTKTDTYRFSIFSANTLSDTGGYIHLYPSNFDDIDSIGKFVIGATSKTTTSKALEGYPSGALTWVGNDLGGSAIVAKSFNTNGYIKYASGLIIQWMHDGGTSSNWKRQEWTVTGNSTRLSLSLDYMKPSLPIAFTNRHFMSVLNGNDTHGTVLISTALYQLDTSSVGFYYYNIDKDNEGIDTYTCYIISIGY